jgi:hypothetical protein
MFQKTIFLSLISHLQNQHAESFKLAALEFQFSRMMVKTDRLTEKS